MVMLTLNKNTEPYHLELDRFRELELEGRNATDIVTGSVYQLEGQFTIQTAGPTILNIKPRPNE